MVTTQSWFRLFLCLAGLLFVLLFILDLTDRPKTPLSVEEVCSILDENGLSPVVDTTSLYKEAWELHGRYITRSIGVQTDGVYFEFFVLHNKDSAEQVRAGHLNYIRDHLYTLPNSETKTGMSNYSVYTLQANGMYAASIRVENTLVFVTCQEEFSGQVIRILSAMEYLP